MKSKILKITLTILLVALLATILTACPPKNDNEWRERWDNAMNGLEVQIVASSNELWATDMTEESIANLSDAGDYYIARSWAAFVRAVVVKSGFTVERINTLTAFLASEKGKQMLQGEGVQIFELINEAGLTSEDAKNLIYNALEYYLSNGGDVYNVAINNINTLATNPNLSSETRQNLASCLAKLNVEKTAFENCLDDRQWALIYLDRAESSIKTLISFVYSDSMYFKNNTSKSFVDGISNGMLQGATAGEIATYMNSMTESIKGIARTLANDPINIYEAVDGLCVVYEKLAIDNEILDGIFSVVVDQKPIPTISFALSEMADNFEDIALKQNGGNYGFVEGLKTALGDGYVMSGDSASANEKIGYIRIGLALAGIDYIATGNTLSNQIANAKTFVEKIADNMLSDEIMDGDRNAMKLSAMLYLDSEEGTTVGDGVSAVRVCEYWIVDTYLANFKKLWTKHSAGGEINLTALRSSAQVLMRYATGEEVVDVGSNYTQDWYENIVRQTEAKMESEARACYPSVKADIDNKIDLFFENGIDKLIEIALMNPVPLDSPEYSQFDDEVDALYESALLMLFGKEQ